MNRQSRKTRQAIFTAFGTLLNQKKYSKITMQEIADLADVGRSTVYSHFETKENLMIAMCRDMFEEMSASGHVGSDSPESMLVALLTHIKENKKVIIGIFASESMDIFIGISKHLLNAMFMPLLGEYDETVTGLPKDFLLNHLVGSFMEAVKWWVTKKMELSPEDMAQYFIKVAKPTIESLVNA